MGVPTWADWLRTYQGDRLELPNGKPLFWVEGQYRIPPGLDVNRLWAPGDTSGSAGCVVFYDRPGDEPEADSPTVVGG